MMVCWGWSKWNLMFIALTFLLTTKTSVRGDGDGAGKTIANVAVNNKTMASNGTVGDAKNTPALKHEETPHAKITSVDDDKNKGKESVGEHRAGQLKNETNTIPFAHVPSLNPGALRRAFYVFAGLSVIVLVYLMIRSFGFKKNPAQMVRKYGVLAHKQDMEMRPLPLDEDDDDDTTVFDISGVSPQRPQPTS